MRRLVVCSDGTWSTLSKKNLTNVSKVASAVRPAAADGTPQLVCYDAGVGTGGLLDRLTGGAFGSGLYENVKDAYQFLMNNYMEGDEIYLFGFSRGAFTVRSLGGLIRKCGLLHKKHVRHIREAYDIYRNGRKGSGGRGTYQEGWPDTAEAVNFREEFSREIGIKFIGVWDTVGALGLQIARRLGFSTYSRNEFHDLRLSMTVERAYQALAIDEKRRFFQPSLWEQQENASPTQILEQVWFAGCHSDVGGGLRQAGLSNVAFTWMREKAEAAGLAFDDESLEALGCEPDPLARIHESWRLPWSLIPSRRRKLVARSNSNEAVAATVMQRYREDERYRPANLIEYLKRSGSDEHETGPNGPAR